MPGLTSFKQDILPLFSELDIRSMIRAFDLSKYEDVKSNAAQIYDRVRGVGGAIMPPPPPRGDGPWTEEKVVLFAKWMADGHPE